MENQQKLSQLKDIFDQGDLDTKNNNCKHKVKASKGNQLKATVTALISSAPKRENRNSQEYFRNQATIC